MTTTARRRLALPGICLLLTAGFVAGVRAQCLLNGLATPEVPEDSYLGQSVSIDGDRIAAGAPYEEIGDDDLGAVYVFRRVGAAWAREARIVAADAEDNWYFGMAVSLSGDRLAIGAEQADTHDVQTGAVYVYTRVGGEWVLEDKLAGDDSEPSDDFGGSVDLHGDLLVVGADRHSGAAAHSGAVYVFRRTAAGWEQEQELTQNDPTTNHELGRSVAATDEFIVAGTTDDDDLGDFAGAVYVFRRSGDMWVQEDKLRASDGAEEDLFGVAVAIDGDWVAVGADLQDGFASNGGAVYMFHREGGVWVQRQKLGAADIGAGWNLGVSVDLDGSLLAAGAESADGTVAHSGAAYVYRLEGSTWSEIAKVWAEDGELSTYFGQSVGIEGTVIAVGEYNSNVGGDYSGRVHAFAVAGDCNANGEPDLCDVAAGVSGDCDGDGVPDECEDDCDADGTPDDCEADLDSDGVPDDCDNCPSTVNADQADTDRDGFGDACDGCPDDASKTTPGECGCGVAEVDTDGDGIVDCHDNCPETPNADQADENGDGIGDACAAPASPAPAAGCGGCGTAGVLMIVCSLVGIWLSKGRLRRGR
jgi:hypothetical protein